MSGNRDLFPAVHDAKFGGGDKFSWLTKYVGLTYSPSLNKCFCVSCVLNISILQPGTFVSGNFTTPALLQGGWQTFTTPGCYSVIASLVHPIVLLLKIGATEPVTTCTNERGHSYTKIVKTRLRSSMDERRLNACCMIKIHYSHKIDIKRVATKFLAVRSRLLDFDLSYIADGKKLF